MPENSDYRDKTTEAKHHASYVPRLSLEERDRRWQFIRELMVTEGLDCLLIVGNDRHFNQGMAYLRYITHIGSYMGAFAVFPLVGEPVVWEGIPHSHIPANRYHFTQNWIDDIRVNTGPAPIVNYLKEHKYDRGRIGIVGGGSKITSEDIISASVYDYFNKELPDANMVSATGLMKYVCLIKSPEEIKMLENAGVIARKTIDVAIQSAEPGKKECEIYADMVRSLISNGGEAQIFILLSSGPVNGQGENKLLLHGAMQPVVPTTRTLEVGDIIMFEFHANYAGYLAAAEFSIFLGKAPDELKRIHEVSVQCAESLREAMRPGTTLKEVLEAEREPCLRAGMDYVELGFHEHGLVSPGTLVAVCKPGTGRLAGEEIGALKVRENMVFGTNIDIHDPKWKRDVGIMLGDTLHITKDGARCLVNTPLNFLEKN